MVKVTREGFENLYKPEERQPSSAWVSFFIEARRLAALARERQASAMHGSPSDSEDHFSEPDEDRLDNELS